MAKVLQEEIMDTLSKIYLFHHVPSQFSEIDDKTLISVYMRLLCVYDYDNKFSSDDVGAHLQHILRCLRPLGLGYLVKKSSELLIKKKASRIILALHDKNFSRYENNISQRVRMILKKEDIQAKKNSRRNIISSDIHPQGLTQEQEVLEEEGTVTRQETWLSSISKTDGFVLPPSPPPLTSAHAPQSVGGRVIPGGWQIPRTPLKTQSAEAIKPETDDLPICPIPPPPSFVDSPCNIDNESSYASQHQPSNPRLSSIILSPPGNFADEKSYSKCQFKLPLSPVKVCKEDHKNREHLLHKEADEICTSIDHAEKSIVNPSKTQSNPLKNPPTALHDNSKRRTFVVSTVLNSNYQDVDQKTPCPEDNNNMQDCLNDVAFNSVNYTPESDTQERNQLLDSNESLRSPSNDLSLSDSQCSSNTESSSQPHLFDTDTSESVSCEDVSPHSVTCMSKVVSTFDSTFIVPAKNRVKENDKRRTYCVQNDQAADCVNAGHSAPGNIKLNEVTYCSSPKYISENSTPSKEITDAGKDSACLTGNETTVHDEKDQIDDGKDRLAEQTVHSVNQTINKNESNLEVTVYEEDGENSECNNSFFYLLKGNTVLRKPLSKIPKGQDLPRTPPFGTNVTADRKLPEHKVVDVCTTPTSSKIDVNGSSVCKSVGSSLSEKSKSRESILDSFRLSDNSLEIFPSKNGKTNEKSENRTESNTNNKETDVVEMCSDQKSRANFTDGSDSGVILKDHADKCDKKVPPKSKKVIEKSTKLNEHKGKDNTNAKENTTQSKSQSVNDPLQHLNEIQKVKDLLSNPPDTLETSNQDTLSLDDKQTRSRRRVTLEKKTSAIEEKTKVIPSANEKPNTRRSRLLKEAPIVSEGTLFDTEVEVIKQEKISTKEIKKTRTKASSKKDSDLKTKQIIKMKVNDPTSEMEGGLEEKQTIEESKVTSTVNESTLPVVQNESKLPARRTRSKKQMKNEESSETEVNSSEGGTVQTAKDLTKKPVEKSSLKLLQNTLGSVDGSNTDVRKTKRKEKVAISKKTSVEIETCDSPSKGKKILNKKTSVEIETCDSPSKGKKILNKKTSVEIETCDSPSKGKKILNKKTSVEIETCDSPSKGKKRLSKKASVPKDKKKVSDDVKETVEPKKPRVESGASTSLDCKDTGLNLLEENVAPKKSNLRRQPKSTDLLKLESETQRRGRSLAQRKIQEIPVNEFEHDLESQKELQVEPKVAHQIGRKGILNDGKRNKSNCVSVEKPEKIPDFKSMITSKKKHSNKDKGTKTNKTSSMEIVAHSVENDDPNFKENKSSVATKKVTKERLKKNTNPETKTEVIKDDQNASQGRTPFSEILNVRPSRRCKAKTLTAILECLDDTN